MPEKRIRIAVPYTERMVTVPNCGFSSLAEALWNTTHDDCEGVKLHESALLASQMFGAVATVVLVSFLLRLPAFVLICACLKGRIHSRQTAQPVRV